MGTMTNSEDPDEMLHKAAFHQGLPCLLRQKKFILFGIMTCNPSIYTMDHPNDLENSIGLKKNSIDLKKIPLVLKKFHWS